MKSIPEINKGQLITLGIVVVAFVAVIVLVAVKWNQIKAWIRNKQIEKTYDEQIVKSEISLTAAQAQGVADKMYAAMNGPGTDFKNLYAAFAVINSYSDLMLVIKCFGQRKGSWNWFGSEASLMEWIAADCDAGEISKINALLASKNINFTF